MKYTLLLPFFFIKSLSPFLCGVNGNVATNDENQPAKVRTNACIKYEYQNKNLNPSVVLNKLQEVNNNRAKYIQFNKSFNQICGVMIAKNQTSNSFTFEYNSFPIELCNNKSDHNIICDNSEYNKCNMALKCCDSNSKLCTNAFGLKKVDMNGLNPITVVNGDECTRKNTTNCFMLEQLYNPTNDKPTDGTDRQIHSGGQLAYLLNILFLGYAFY